MPQQFPSPFKGEGVRVRVFLPKLAGTTPSDYTPPYGEESTSRYPCDQLLLLRRLQFCPPRPLSRRDSGQPCLGEFRFASNRDRCLAATDPNAAESLHCGV